jgi:hypothetical protein
MYRVGQIIGSSLSELVETVRRELERLALQLSQPADYTALKTIHAEPGRVFEGQIVKADGTDWNPGYGGGPYIYSGSAWVPMFGAGSQEAFVVPISDQTTNLTTGHKMTWRFPYPFVLTDVRASVNTAQASGDILTFDVKESTASLLSTKVTIDNGEKTSKTGDTQRVISDTALGTDNELTFHIDQVGTAGAKGAVITLIGHQ